MRFVKNKSYCTGNYASHSMFIMDENHHKRAKSYNIYSSFSICGMVNIEEVSVKWKETGAHLQ